MSLVSWLRSSLSPLSRVTVEVSPSRDSDHCDHQSLMLSLIQGLTPSSVSILEAFNLCAKFLYGITFVLCFGEKVLDLHPGPLGHHPPVLWVLGLETDKAGGGGAAAK